MEHRRKLTEAELKAAAARLHQIYAPAYAMIEARQKAEAEAAKAKVKQPFVKPEPKPKAEITTPAIADEAKPKVIVEFPPKLSEQELMRRQAVIDQHWQAMLDEKEFLRRQRMERCGGSFHKSIDDDDFEV